MMALAVVLALVATEPSPTPAPPRWQVEASGSATSTTGNTQGSSVSASGAVTLQPSPAWKFLGSASMMRMQSYGFTTTNRRVIGGRGEYAFSGDEHKFGLYATAERYRDPASGINRRSTFEGGGFYRLVSRTTFTLSFLAALTQTWEDRAVLSDLNFPGATTGLEVTIACSPSVTLKTAASYIRDFSNPGDWRYQASGSVTATIWRAFALRGSYWRYYSNQPDQGKYPTDASGSVSVVIGFPFHKK